MWFWYCLRYRPIWVTVSVSDLNQNRGFIGRTLFGTIFIHTKKSNVVKYIFDIFHVEMAQKLFPFFDDTFSVAMKDIRKYIKNEPCAKCEGRNATTVIWLQCKARFE